jgi:hypothetical protein
MQQENVTPRVAPAEGVARRSHRLASAAACTALWAAVNVLAPGLVPGLRSAAGAVAGSGAGPTAAAPADFSGRWVFSPAKSRNAGMMAALQMHVTIEQTADSLTVHEQSSFQGQPSTRDVHYDLAGRTTQNGSPMGDPSETVAHWERRRLVAAWTSAGAIAGSRVVRTETRELSDDGRTMTLETVRGTNAPVVMAFERE